MPIRAVKDIEARRAALARAQESILNSDQCTIPEVREDTSPAATVLAAASLAGGGGLLESTEHEPSTSKRQRGHARRGDDGKWLPTGSTGFAAPPKQHRFQKGNPGGGRKRKIEPSADDIWRRHLSEKRRVKIGGEEKTLEVRELLAATTLKAALAGDRAARQFALAMSERLYPAPEKHGTDDQMSLHASDALSLAEHRAEIEAEILRQIEDADVADQVGAELRGGDEPGEER